IPWPMNSAEIPPLQQFPSYPSSLWVQIIRIIGSCYALFKKGHDAQIDFAGKAICPDPKQSVKIKGMFFSGNRNISQNEDLSKRCMLAEEN
ncbi:hypothetical protein WDW86_11320, partial [Bdellovibrionota bacterium FG-2]